jgi:hypothetical protein
VPGMREPHDHGIAADGAVESVVTHGMALGVV